MVGLFAAGFRGTPCTNLEPAVLACDAAAELDDLLATGQLKFRAVRSLAETLKGLAEARAGSAGRSAQEHAGFLFSPYGPAAIYGAMKVDSARPSATTKISDLLKYALDMGEHLAEVAASPADGLRQRLDEIRRLRSFCVALSERACDFDWSVFEPRLPDWS